MKTIAVALFVAAASIPTAFAQSSPTLARIKAAGAINVAYSADSLPFSFTETNGDVMGYSIDLCKRVIAQIGRAVGKPNLKVNWMPANTPARLQMVATGKADMECANTTQTIGRLDNVDFSSLIFLETGGFIGRKDSPSKLGDMGGKKIAVLKGTTTESRLNAALKAKLVNASVVAIENAGDGMAMLEMGSADLYAGDRIKLIGLVTQAKDPNKFILLGEEISYEPYAFALPRNDSGFRLEVNRALTQVYISGEIEGIYGQWLGRLGKPSQLLMGMYLLYAIPD